MSRAQRDKHLRRLERAHRDVQEAWSWAQSLDPKDSFHPQSLHSAMQDALFGVGGAASFLRGLRTFKKKADSDTERDA